MGDSERAYLVRRWKDELRAVEHARSDEAVDRHQRLASGYARRIAALDAAYTQSRGRAG